MSTVSKSSSIHDVNARYRISDELVMARRVKELGAIGKAERSPDQPEGFDSSKPSKSNQLHQTKASRNRVRGSAGSRRRDRSSGSEIVDKKRQGRG